jgi:hypothetical protein
MTSRAVTDTPTLRLTPEEEGAERASILNSLHAFARATGAAPGDDVVRFFDAALRRAVEREEATT